MINRAIYQLREKRFLRLWLLSVGMLLVYIGIRNYWLIQEGLLKPDFGAIHRAYDFNLWELPWISLGFGVIFLVFGSLFGQRSYLWGAFFYVFVAVDLFALRYYVTEVEPQRLVVHTIRLETPKLTESVRLLHISDIQSGRITEYERKIFKTIEALHPDLILNTGDFLQVVPPANFDGEAIQLLEMINRVNPRFGTFGVFGDTELEFYQLNQDELGALKMLSSRTEVIDTGAGVISIHGLSLYDSRSPEWARRTIDQWLSQSRDAEFRILMGHAPDYVLRLKQEPIDLCLAGHTHGGQVRLPFFGPLVIDSKIPTEWASGFRRVGVPYLNVSAGAGSNRFEGLPPMRFNCPTEMTLIELVPLKSIQ